LDSVRKVGRDNYNKYRDTILNQKKEYYAWKKIQRTFLDILI